MDRIIVKVGAVICVNINIILHGSEEGVDRFKVDSSLSDESSE